MQTPSFSLNPDAWYEAYETLSGTQEQAAFLLDTLRQPLTQEDFDKSDLGGVLIDFVSECFEWEKRFEDTLDFLRQFEQLQPGLYAGEFHYYADYIFDYYCFTGRAEEAEPVIRFFRENPNADIDSFLPLQRAVWYWLKQDWGAQLAADTYRPVREHKGYWGTPEIEMALAMHTSNLQKVYEHWQRSGTFDPDAAKAAAADYHFSVSEAIWERYRAALSTHIDTATAASRFAREKRDDFMTELNLRFLVWMHHRGFPFYSAHLIWESLVNYWEELHPKSTAAHTYFDLDKKSFDRYVAGKKNLIFPQIEEIGATLWGAAFMYDFLGDSMLIGVAARENAQKAIAALKQDFLNGLESSVWKSAFVVKVWPKADTVPQSDFEADIARFEAGFLRVPPRVEQQESSFDQLLDSIPLFPGLKPDKPRSFYEQAFGNKPPTRSKKKKKKKKR